ncbi:MAG: hypothetical protein AAGA31_19180, partial [Bacteroidota bacterium]
MLLFKIVRTFFYLFWITITTITSVCGQLSFDASSEWVYDFNNSFFYGVTRVEYAGVVKIGSDDFNRFDK